MWKRKREVRIDNTGSFTIEAVFVVVIIVGVVMTMLYVTMYCYDQVTMECKVWEHMKDDNKEDVCVGQLGTGQIRDSGTVGRLDYRILIKYPLTQEYLQNQFTKFTVKVRVYDKRVCEFVRMYDAIKSKG